ncbi:MAG: histidine phosphotransferase family protein [Pseudomonadota bacterium]
MSDTIDAKTLELISSKICHDLISPIGAINNGVEIFQEMGGGEDVMDLIATSADLASAKLKAYRIAYGAGGSDATIKPSDAHTVIAGILEHEKRITQEWDPSASLGPEMLPTGTAKMLTAFLLLTLECLPRGGVISAAAGDDNTIVIEATGESPLLKDGFEDCLRQSVNLVDLSPTLTHAFMTGFLAKHYKFDIMSVEHDDTRIAMIVKLPV